MYLITNRSIHPGNTGVELLGDKPNAKGPNELRLIKATKKRNKWHLTAVNDILTNAQKEQLDLPKNKRFYASQLAAIETVQRARKEKKHILFFVHGYNNDVKSVLDRAENFEQLYNVIVVPFSWPANGGGIAGLTCYRDDKRDAYISKGALDRTLDFMHQHLGEITEDMQKELWQVATDHFPADAESRNALYTKLIEKACPVSINMLAHSMGNYVFKQVLKSTASAGTGLIFDNVILAAADTNNLDHDLWVDRIRCRRRIFITINENDHALAASRANFGQEHLQRLGHGVDGLGAKKATYINFTDAPMANNSHAYFEGSSLKNRQIKQFFQTAFSGGAAEQPLTYNAAKNLFEFR